MAGLLAFAAGCGGESGNTPTPTGDASTPTDGTAQPDGATGPEMTYDYVINAITIDQQGMTGMAPVPASATAGVTGFNLDGIYSNASDAMMRGAASCSHEDFFSTLDPDQNMGMCAAGTARGGMGCRGGVDNQLPAIAETVGSLGSTDVRMSLRDQVSQGKVAILVRVSGVNGTPGPTFNDSSVTVKVYPVGRPMFANCAMIGMPGQNFAIDSASLTTATDVNSARVSFQGSIVNGRLRVVPPTDMTRANLSINLPVSGMNIPLNLFQAQLRVNMTPDAGSGGNLGGYIPLMELVTNLAPLLPMGIPMSTVNAVLMGVIDVQYPMGNAMGCTQPQGAIALGLGFTTVRANIAATPVTGAQPGQCGTTP